jgi:putative membrane-bound dehydrogenase-like protein
VARREFGLSTQALLGHILGMPLWNRASVFASFAVVILFGPFSKSAEIPAPRENWKMELIAEAPKIKYPSVVVCAPDGKVFVAEDPMDITRPGNVAEGRIICFNPDGHTTVFAEKLHAIFGMQYLEGKLYVLHNPHFSVFRDDEGVGKDRTELIEQTNPNPWALDWNDHVPANFRLAMDGRFYVAVGDKGIFGAVGRDGKRVDLHGGGILRLRPDGTELEIYSSGVRNILDVAMTDEDEIFTYDNTDENQWMGRVTHMVDGGFYGYPFDFIPQRPYTLWMMADYGAGAATGTLVNNDDALPPEYRGNLFLADFGQRNIRRVQIERAGGTFRAVKDELMFVNPPADFRPVGITFSDDGLSIYICDWQHRDTKEQAVSGRLWKLSWTGKNYSARRPNWHRAAAVGKSAPASDAELEIGLAHPSHRVRMAAERALILRKSVSVLTNTLARSADAFAKIHAIWALDQIDGGVSERLLISNLVKSADAQVVRQAIRQLGNRRAESVGPLLAQKMNSADASIQFQAATALGRIGDWRFAEELVRHSGHSDLFARHAIFTALNRIARGSPDAWPAIIRGLKNQDSLVRESCAFAMRETYDKELVRMLAAALRYTDAGEADFKVAVLNALAPLHHKPPVWNGEWWAYHPFRLSLPAKTNDWEGTSIVFEALSGAIGDANAHVRAVAASGLGMFGTEAAGDLLIARLDTEMDRIVRAAALRGLAQMKYPKASSLATTAIRNGDLSEEMISLAKAARGPEITEALEKAIRKNISGAERAISALVEMGATNSIATITAALDGSNEAQRAALKALGTFKARSAIGEMLRAAENSALRAEAIQALAEMSDARATDLFLSGLAEKRVDVRVASAKGLRAIREDAWINIELKLKTLPPQTISELQRIYRNDARAEAAGLNAISIDRPPPQTYFDFATANLGDAARGENIFKNRNGVGCINCHRARGQGVDIGPDLSGVGAQFDRAALAESVLFPSRAVREGYNVVEVELNDGEAISGMIRAETAEALSVQSAVGAPQTIPKSNIKSRKATPVSLMPEGLEAGLSLEEFSDLISFLQSLRSGT